MRIRRRHNLGMEEARNRADRIAADLGPQLSLRSNWQGDNLMVTGRGVSGHLRVAEDAIEIFVELCFALKLMEGPIRAVIEMAFDEVLA